MSMRLILKTASRIKELYDLIANERSTIEKEFGEPLIWDRDAGAYECHISLLRDDMDPRDMGVWPQQHAWLANTAVRFDIAFRSHVNDLGLG